MNFGYEPGQPKFGRFKNGKEKKTNPKSLFRQSEKWKQFRISMIGMNQSKCELCGMIYPGKRDRMLQVHHLNPADYEVLNPADFSVLCSSCHDTVERWVTRINGRDFFPPSNMKLWYILLGHHISQPARSKLEEIITGTYQYPQKAAKKPKGKKNEI